MTEEKEMQIDSSLFSEIDDLISQTDLSNVSAESSGFDPIPDGYYLTEVVKAEITRSKSSGKPMVSLRLQVVGDGFAFNSDSDEFEPIKGMNKRIIFKHYPFSDPASIRRFVSDMIKFEDPEKPGVALLPRENWTSAEGMETGIEALEAFNSKIYVNIETKDRGDGTKSSWTRLISFADAQKRGLPVDD